jgi:hypothetical protein
VVTRVGVVQPGGEEGGVHGLGHQVISVQQVLPVQGGRQLQVILRTEMYIIVTTEEASPICEEEGVGGRSWRLVLPVRHGHRHEAGGCRGLTHQ